MLPPCKLFRKARNSIDLRFSVFSSLQTPCMKVCESAILMKSDAPKVIIVILNWNGLADTLECLTSLQKVTYPNFAVMVVDNGSRGNDAEIIREKFGAFVSVLTEEKNLGFAGGCNEGIRWALRSGAEYILLLNNDTTVDPNCLKEMVEVAQSDPLIGMVGPKICYYDKPNTILAIGGKVNLWTGITPVIGTDEIDNGQFNCVEEVDFVAGTALLVKAETVRRIGLLDEVYFAYYEETDWCCRARSANLKIIPAPAAKVLHKTHKKSSELYTYYMTRNRFIFEKRNADGVHFLVFSIYFFASDFILQIKCKTLLKPRLLRAYLKGIRDGLLSLAAHKEHYSNGAMGT